MLSFVYCFDLIYVFTFSELIQNPVGVMSCRKLSKTKFAFVDDTKESHPSCCCEIVRYTRYLREISASIFLREISDYFMASIRMIA